MSAKLKLLSTLVVCLLACTFTFGQSASTTPNPKAKKVKVKKSKKAQEKYYMELDKAAKKENYSYNTDLYDAISPGFSNEIPATKTRIYNFDENDTSTAYTKKAKSTKTKGW